MGQVLFGISTLAVGIPFNWRYRPYPLVVPQRVGRDSCLLCHMNNAEIHLPTNMTEF